MSEIQQNRYDQLLRRVCDLKGPGSKVAWSVGDLLPTIDVENIPAELQLLYGTRLCMAHTATGAGGAGTFGVHLLRNNLGSGAIGRLVQISVQLSGNDLIICGPTQNSGTPGGDRAFADTRVFGEGTALVTHQDNTGLVFGSDFFRFNADADLQGWWTPPNAAAVIAPGAAFSVSNGVANTSLNVSWLWLERTAQPSELEL